MNIDDRLRQAFSDLENRVHTLQSPQQQPTRRRYSGLVVGFATALAVIAVFLAGGSVGSGDRDVVSPGTPTIDTPPTPSTPTTAIPATTSVPIQTTPPAATALPAGTLLVLATADGALAYTAGGESHQVLPTPMAAVSPTAQGNLVYQTERGGDIFVDGSVLVEADDSTLALFGVFDWNDEGPFVAYTVTTGVEDQRREMLHMIELSSPENDVEITRVGGYETGLVDVSVNGTLIVYQITGEGFYETYGWAQGQERGIATIPTPNCAIGDDAQPCHVATNISDDGTRFVSVRWTGDQADLVVTDVASGEPISEIGLPPIEVVDGIDVEWPLVVVNTAEFTDEGYQVGSPLLFNFSEGEAFPFKISQPGRGSLIPSE